MHAPAKAGMRMLNLRMVASLPVDGESTRPDVNRLHLRRRSYSTLCPTGSDAADEDIKERCEDQTEEGDAEHSREDGNSHDVTHFRAGAAREHKGQDSHDECKRRHQNRTQTDACCLEGRAESVAALLLEIPRELDDQDRILAGEPDEDEETDLREDVVVAAGEPHARNGRQETHRHDENDHEWQRPALVLRRQDEENEQDAQREYEYSSVASELLLVRELGPLVPQAVRQRLPGQPLHRLNGFARAHTGRRAAVDVGGGVAVVVRYLIWSV